VKKSALEALYARCAIQIDTFTFTFYLYYLPSPILSQRYCSLARIAEKVHLESLVTRKHLYCLFMLTFRIAYIYLASQTLTVRRNCTVGYSILSVLFIFFV